LNGGLPGEFVAMLRAWFHRYTHRRYAEVSHSVTLLSVLGLGVAGSRLVRIPKRSEGGSACVNYPMTSFDPDQRDLQGDSAGAAYDLATGAGMVCAPDFVRGLALAARNRLRWLAVAPGKRGSEAKIPPLWILH
jgi:hypothetical protein